MKTLKRILFISDDFPGDRWEDKKEDCEPGDYFFGGGDDEANWLRFEFHLIESFKELTPEGFDAVLVDYGLVNDAKNMKVLERMCKDNIPIAWVSGFDSWCNADAKDNFPGFPLLYNLPTSCIGDDDILILLYEIFRENKDKIGGIKYVEERKWNSEQGDECNGNGGVRPCLMI